MATFLKKGPLCAENNNDPTDGTDVLDSSFPQKLNMGFDNDHLIFK